MQRRPSFRRGFELVGCGDDAVQAIGGRCKRLEGICAWVGDWASRQGQREPTPSQDQRVRQSAPGVPAQPRCASLHPRPCPALRALARAWCVTAPTRRHRPGYMLAGQAGAHGRGEGCSRHVWGGQSWAVSRPARGGVEPVHSGAGGAGRGQGIATGDHHAAGSLFRSTRLPGAGISSSFVAWRGCMGPADAGFGAVAWITVAQRHQRLAVGRHHGHVAEVGAAIEAANTGSTTSAN